MCVYYVLSICDYGRLPIVRCFKTFVYLYNKYSNLTAFKYNHTRNVYKMISNPQHITEHYKVDIQKNSSICKSIKN